MTHHTAFQAATGKAPEGFDTVLAISDTNRQVKVYYDPYHSEMVIGFDCTKGSPWPPSGDWKANLMTWTKSLSVGATTYKAHAGFVSEYLSMREQILHQVFIYAPKMIRVIGFSQGAAHATLCWRDLVYRFPGAQVHGLAFASPRVYDSKSASEFERTRKGDINHTFLRVNLWGDPVPDLPPSVFGFQHVGKVSMIGKYKLFWDTSVHNGGSYLRNL